MPSIVVIIALYLPCVQVGDLVMVVESEKADMEIESFEEGYLAKVLSAEGTSAKVGTAVTVIVER